MFVRRCVCTAGLAGLFPGLTGRNEKAADGAVGTAARCCLGRFGGLVGWFALVGGLLEFFVMALACWPGSAYLQRMKQVDRLFLGLVRVSIRKYLYFLFF